MKKLIIKNPNFFSAFKLKAAKDKYVKTKNKTVNSHIYCIFYEPV